MPIPKNSFEAMLRFARAHALPFPYLHDEDQSVARAYGAVCTPDYFGYDASRRLKYRGRLDEGRTSPPPPGARRELVEANCACHFPPAPNSRSPINSTSNSTVKGSSRRNRRASRSPCTSRGSGSSGTKSSIRPLSVQELKQASGLQATD